MKTITIKEDFRLPGTNVILEKGDKIQVKEGSKLKEATINPGDIAEVVAVNSLEAAVEWFYDSVVEPSIDIAKDPRSGNIFNPDKIIDFWRFVGPNFNPSHPDLKKKNQMYKLRDKNA